MGNVCSCAKPKPKLVQKSGNPPLQVKAGEQNALLDRLGTAQVKLLQDKFKAIQLNGGLDLKGFKSMLPLISQLPVPVVKSAFQLFCSNNIDKITWQNFCLTISQYVLGRSEDKCRFIFKIFDITSKGYLQGKDLQALQRHCSNAIRLPTSSSASDVTNIFEACLKDGKPLMFDDFKLWAIEHLELRKVMEYFEIIPSPISEKEIIKNILREYERIGLREGDKWNVISYRWFEAWRKYVDFEYEEPEDIDSPPDVKIRSKSAMYGARPIEINNHELRSYENPFKLAENIRDGGEYLCIPNEAWTKLVSWYGGGPEFLREVIIENNRPTIELYPAILNILVKKSNASSFSKEPIVLVFSKKKRVQAVLDKLMSKLNLEGEPRLCLIEGDGFKALEPNWTLEQCGLIDVKKCAFELVDKRSDEEYVPSDLIIEEYKEGDPVEYQENDNWMSGNIKEIRENKYIIAISWKPTPIEILKKDISKLRKPSRICISNDEVSGATGLWNMGNTCYVNAIVQPLSHTPLFSEFFSSEAHIAYINATNPNGSKGKIAKEFGGLLKELKQSKVKCIKPVKFISEFIKVYDIFKGNDQHDSHEFLSMLLDGLHEDLNRRSEEAKITQSATLKNPSQQQEIQTSREQWEQLQGERGSVISDLCGGQIRNCLTCPSCSDKKVRFEHFMDLSVPIPIKENDLSIVLTFIPRNSTKYRKLKIRVAKDDPIEALLINIQNKTQVSPSKLIFGFIDDSFITHVFQPTEINECIPPKKSVSLVAYEIITSIEEGENDGKPTIKKPVEENWRDMLKPGQLVDYLCIGKGWIAGEIQQIKDKHIEITLEDDSAPPIVAKFNSSNIAPFRHHTTNDDNILKIKIIHARRAKTNEYFSVPILLTIGNWYTWKELYMKITELCTKMVKNPPENLKDSMSLFVLSNETMACALCSKKNCNGCKFLDSNDSIKWFEEKTEEVFICVYWRMSLYNKLVIPREIEDYDVFSIYDCLHQFTQQETLDMICKKCPEQKIVGQTEIWRVPDILIIHLKRFRYNKNRLEKICNTINFPLESLDISSWMLSSEKTVGNTVSTTRENCMYDLFAVVNHSGGSVEGGHYTCYCLHKTEEKSTWLYFDDDRVYSVTEDAEKEIVTSRAYILFYRRQRFAPSNVVNLFALN
ncbi:unnamed protein product [Blepharisma stoltei]|uniref:Ubiquitinyl hydrolase 1 n=1 Tax=Blepharisma stoltei TaxID=1481888 RepID=A0AAU9IMK1_9CILI|nr:unnamed protein product [Blepharisma stoltei]